MGKTGWRKQLFGDDYPETKTNYGQDLRALEGEKLTKTPDKHERISLQKKCPDCGKMFWVDKGCTYCKKLKDPLPPAAATPIRSERVQVKVLCPRCGSPMRIRFKKGRVNQGQPFYGCSRYPACKGTSPKYKF
jgi:ssDNA-binding Zn-finger/Zn-ribbon topoisomerase 1